MKTRFVKCVICKAPFVQGVSTHKVCSVECSIENVKQQKEYKEKIAKKEWNERKKKIKEELMTITDWLDKAQKEFNKYIRIRDRGKLCISCNNKPSKSNAGHYFASNKFPNVRFDEYNVHLQCEYCNTHLHANLLSYQDNLIEKIGLEQYALLKQRANVKHSFTIDEAKFIIEKYKSKIRKPLEK